MTLDDATDIDLLTTWLKRRREAGDKMLTRSAEVEVRHVCLYAKQQLEQLRTEVIRPGIMPGHVLMELREVITNLEGLAAYIETGKGGGFSSLGDRNKA